jgi:flagellar basal body-associated protein FliL
VLGSVSGVVGQIRQVFGGLLSPDWPTRRMSMLFVLRLAGVVVVATLSVHRYRVLKARGEFASEQPGPAGVEHLGDFIGKQALEARRKNTTLVVGTFYVELRYNAEVDSTKLVPGVASAAEVEVVAECDLKKTCDFIEQHGSQARNEIINVLVPMDRDELMSRDGKRRLKKAIQDRLNAWIQDGRVENVYFSRLIVG